MTRCAIAARRRALSATLAWGISAVSLGLGAVLPAHAQVHRNFPQNALRGTIAFGEPPQLTLNGQAARLAPGGRIHGPDNMIVMSGRLVGQTATVDYTVESTGMVMDVWILRPEEAAVQPWPRTAQQAASWHFDPVAQLWSSD